MMTNPRAVLEENPDRISEIVNRYLRSRPLISCDVDCSSSQHYARLMQLIEESTVGFESAVTVEAGSLFADAMQSVAHGIIYAVLDRLEQEFGWDAVDSDRAFSALAEQRFTRSPGHALDRREVT